MEKAEYAPLPVTEKKYSTFDTVVEVQDPSHPSPTSTSWDGKKPCICMTGVCLIIIQFTIVPLFALFLYHASMANHEVKEKLPKVFMSNPKLMFYLVAMGTVNVSALCCCGFFVLDIILGGALSVGCQCCALVCLICGD